MERKMDQHKPARCWRPQWTTWRRRKGTCVRFQYGKRPSQRCVYRCFVQGNDENKTAVQAQGSPTIRVHAGQNNSPGTSPGQKESLVYVTTHWLTQLQLITQKVKQVEKTSATQCRPTSNIKRSAKNYFSTRKMCKSAYWNWEKHLKRLFIKGSQLKS